jgi:2-polyprenyl-3-methyl-5-hydroxy-6-metoxy-1,4-benzoquinol methylase
MTMLKEEEIRPLELMDEQSRLFADDVARLMNGRDSFVEVPCPACDSRDCAPALEKTGMKFVTCGDCGTLYANPRPTPDQMRDYYANSKNYAYWSKYIFPASEPVRREKIFKPRVRRVLDLCQKFGIPTDVLLEVGAGFGSFCDEMARTNAFGRIVAVEPTPSLAEDCRRLGLEVIERPIEEIRRDELVGERENIDVIANFEVIEHLFSPREFVLKCAELLNPGGIFIVTCPNSRGFDILELREMSSAVDVEHVNLFHPQALAHLLERCGFDVIEVQTPGRLDAGIVRKHILNGDLEVTSRPFLKRVLVDEWEECGEAFQDFLEENMLSSNMLAVGRKRGATATPQTRPERTAPGK